MLLSFFLGVAAPHVFAQQPEAGTKRFEDTKAKAEKGDAQAQCNLGLCYEEGAGVAKDAAEAVKWYRKAADQGHASRARLFVAQQMTPEQIAGAFRSARDFKPKRQPESRR